MDRRLLLFLIGALSAMCSCSRTAEESEKISVRLQFDQGVSKVDALAAGDAAGVFLRTDGTERYALENHRFESDNAGVLSGVPSVYFPDASQAAVLYAYLPYQPNQNDPRQIAYSLPTDQTAAADRRAADLLWGATSTTPTETAVPVSFVHLFSKVTVSVAGQTVDGVVVHGVQTQGTLDAASGAFTSSAARADVAGGAELIVPAQSIAALTVRIGGTNYSFQPSTPLVLEAGKSHAVNLTLNSSSYTAELAAPIAVTNWTTDSRTDAPAQTASNSVTLHWLMPHQDFASTTAIKLTVVDRAGGASATYDATNVVLAGGDNLACTFTFDFSSPSLYYAWSVESVSFYNGGQLIQRCESSSLVASTFYKSGAYTLGISQSNILDVTLGTTPISLWLQHALNGPIAGGVVNQFVVQMIEPANANYKTADRLKMAIDGHEYTFNITFDARSNTLMGLVDAFSFMDELSGPKKTPSSYPFRIESLEFYQGTTLVLDFSCTLDITRGGLITIQTFVGDVVGITTQAVSGWTPNNPSGSMEAPFSSNPVSLVFYDAAGAAKTATRVDLTIGGNVVSLTGFAMGGYTVAAQSTNKVDIKHGSGTKPTKYPYTITDVKVYNGATLLNSGASATSIAVRESGDLTIRVAK